jgi:hypothetical protein
MAAMQDVAILDTWACSIIVNLASCAKCPTWKQGGMLDIPPSGVTAWLFAAISAVLVLPWSELR